MRFDSEPRPLESGKFNRSLTVAAPYFLNCLTDEPTVRRIEIIGKLIHALALASPSSFVNDDKKRAGVTQFKRTMTNLLCHSPQINYPVRKQRNAPTA